MVKISELSLVDRQRMISGISGMMEYQFSVDTESINEFWDTLGTGIELKRRV